MFGTLHVRVDSASANNGVEMRTTRRMERAVFCSVDEFVLVDENVIGGDSMRGGIWLLWRLF